ncbi:MAG: DNA repair protein RadA [Bacteroidales bacterium]|nr:DNA repair protein RadA [Bacteroidales bacterium]MBN2698539.1 DNA repair protein RadA [Bacteroidales bacterium]
MAKSKTAYVCQNCGAESPKWIGRCYSCGEWNTFVEQIIHKESPRSGKFGSSGTAVVEKLLEIQSDDLKRLDLHNGEFNRVLGGGLVPGSVVLIGGEPGIGKSTLALQVAMTIERKTLYVSGEESPQQIRMRADRLGILNDQLMVLPETSLQAILNQVKNIDPDLIVIDSIQTLYSSDLESTPGSVSQVRECAAQLLRMAKETGIPVILIGHITKEGSLAGPKVLEHIVDTVLQFEGDTHHMYRILRASKNRFGSTSELGVFEMQNRGLIEIANPSELLINQQPADLSGSAIAANMEGIRPLMIEVQALVSSAVYGTPQRTSTGFDLRRLSMLLAVLEKRANFKLASKDVFINIAGGIRVDDPAIDLAVVAAVLSSTIDIPVESQSCMAGEVGLSGEIRPVNRIEQRMMEAEKLGFRRIFIPTFNKKGIDLNRFSMQIVEINRIQELAKYLFG